MMFKLFVIYVAVVFTKFVYPLSQDIYCREKRNVTLLGFDERAIDILGFLIVDDPCIHLNIFDLHTMKTIPYQSRGIKPLDRTISNDDDVLAIQFLYENTHVSDQCKQSLFYHPFDKVMYTVEKVEKMYNELEKLQNDHGWDVIITSSIINDVIYPCPKRSWIAPNRILSENSYDIDPKNVESQMRNPDWDSVRFLKRTGMENVQKSCFEKERIVVNIIFHKKFTDVFPYVQKAMAMVLQFGTSKRNIKFHLHMPYVFQGINI